VPEVLAVTATDDEGGDAPRGVPALALACDGPVLNNSWPIHSQAACRSQTIKDRFVEEQGFRSRFLPMSSRAGADHTGGLFCDRLGRAGLRG
jgi:hypothetical protein